MFCSTVLHVHSSKAIILMGKRELVVLLNLSSWCLVVVGRFFIEVPQGCLRFVIVVFPDHTHLLFLVQLSAQWDRKNTFKMKLLSLFHKKYNHIQPFSFSYNGLNSHDSIMFQSLDPLLNSFV